jgi:hypothetical protein
LLQIMQAPREEFSSKFGESTIYLGHFKNKDHKVEHYDDRLLAHSRTLETTQTAVVKQGLDQTRFHKGFNRRQQENIPNPFATADAEYAAVKAVRTGVINGIRQETMKAQQNRAGYDIISGQIKGNGPAPTPGQGPKLVGDGLGPEAPLRGKSILRESGGRFFAPLGSGHNHEHRQKVLYNEGLSVERKCGILEPCKGDLPSYGLEDQFSKSEYTRNSTVTRTGLYETRIPGTYTPRKIANHPAGNPAIVEKWNTNIDLNNRTLQCKL